MLDGRERVERSVVLAQVLQLVGDIPRAETVVVQARERAVELGELDLVARCDHSLAESARRVGRFGEAAELLARALVGFESAGDTAGAADVLQVTGTVAAQRGDAPLAQARYLESLRLREELGDEAGIAALTSNLGIVAQQQGDATAARAYAERALEIYQRLGDRRRISNCEVNLAWMDSLAGDHESARRRCEEAIRLAAEVGDRLNVAIAQNNLGDALRDLGRLDDAGRAYAAAVETYRDLGDLGPLMALLEDVAILAVERGDAAAAYTLAGASDALERPLDRRGPRRRSSRWWPAWSPREPALGSDAADAVSAPWIGARHRGGDRGGDRRGAGCGRGLTAAGRRDDPVAGARSHHLAAQRPAVGLRTGQETYGNLVVGHRY